jgi:beta-galactosidase GanA
MEAAKIKVVRIAEFAWSSMEASEGRYDFWWLDRAIAAAAKHHIAVVLGTPTASPPAWLTSRHPETLRVKENGRRATQHRHLAEQLKTLGPDTVVLMRYGKSNGSLKVQPAVIQHHYGKGSITYIDGILDDKLMVRLPNGSSAKVMFNLSWPRLLRASRSVGELAMASQSF